MILGICMIWSSSSNRTHQFGSIPVNDFIFDSFAFFAAQLFFIDTEIQIQDLELHIFIFFVLLVFVSSTKLIPLFRRLIDFYGLMQKFVQIHIVD